VDYPLILTLERSFWKDHRRKILFSWKSKMKYVLLVGDGMGDYSYDELDGKTVLEYARTPHLDRLAREGLLGLVETIPEKFPPGSDVGNLSLLGYDPRKYYTGRAPLEAASRGITLSERDLALRCNLVTLSEDYRVMRDYSAGHIATAEARRLIARLARELGEKNLEFYAGVSYRHLLVWRDVPVELEGLQLTPPHEIPDAPIEKYLPHGPGSALLRDLIKRSWEVLAPEGSPANSIWLWGAGRTPQMPTLKERFGLEGAVISAVDLIKGLGVYAGLRVIDVPGATGYLDTNYSGKVQAALDALAQTDFVYLHVEAPDECGHQGRLDLKIRAIEDFDARIVGPLSGELSRAYRDFTLVVTTDHYTPVRDRVHVAAPVPFVVLSSSVLSLSALSNSALKKVEGFHERAAQTTGVYIAHGHELLPKVLSELVPHS
jgi:2,3-bisphosphoglycerate-independent phosphoglycerate mutase